MTSYNSTETAHFSENMGFSLSLSLALSLSLPFVLFSIFSPTLSPSISLLPLSLYLYLSSLSLSLSLHSMYISLLCLSFPPCPLMCFLSPLPGQENNRAPELKYNKDVTVRAGDDAILTCIFTYYSKEGWVVKYQEFFLPILIPEKEPVFLFSMLSAKQRKLPGTIFIRSLVWRGSWLRIEPGTSRAWSQHSTTRLSKRRYIEGWRWRSSMCLWIKKQIYGTMFKLSHSSSNH